MSEEKWAVNPFKEIIKENEELRAENFELRKFVNYVRWLKKIRIRRWAFSPNSLIEVGKFRV